MSRIQEILKKAEREGGVHRTRGLASDGPSVSQASSLAATMPAPQAFEPRPWTPIAHEPPPSAAQAGGRTATTEIDSRLVAALAPQSLAAEQYRSLRTRLTRAGEARVLRTMIITSPAKGDGKSLTAANLALTMAQEFQQRVLLVDADLRRPSIHRLFGMAGTPGLSDVLIGAATLEDAVLGLPDHHLSVLASGTIPTHPAELLGSAAMRRTLDTLRARFDRIIIDMPPVAPLADVSVAATLVDGVLMIVRAGVTPKPAIERALSGLDPAKILGLVLNDAGETGAAYGYGGYGYVAG